MTFSHHEFRTEDEMAAICRKVIEGAVNALELDLNIQYEVAGPGCVPDLVAFTLRGRSLHYVITVEFKLRDWRRAINQAFRHRNFGNESYVVLDHAKAGSALRNIGIFKQANIGLLTINPDETLRAWHIPEPTLPFSAEFSRAIARSLLDNVGMAGANLPYTRTVRGRAQLAALTALLDSAY